MVYYYSESLNMPLKILSAVKENQFWNVTTESTGLLQLHESLFLRASPTMRKNFYIVKCNYKCKQIGRKWCRLDKKKDNMKLPGIFDSKYHPFGPMVKCQAAFLTTVRTL